MLAYCRNEEEWDSGSVLEVGRVCVVESGGIVGVVVGCSVDVAVVKVTIAPPELMVVEFWRDSFEKLDSMVDVTTVVIVVLDDRSSRCKQNLMINSFICSTYILFGQKVRACYLPPLNMVM